MLVHSASMVDALFTRLIATAQLFLWIRFRARRSENATPLNHMIFIRFTTAWVEVHPSMNKTRSLDLPNTITPYQDIAIIILF